MLRLYTLLQPEAAITRKELRETEKIQKFYASVRNTKLVEISLQISTETLGLSSGRQTKNTLNATKGEFHK